MSLELIRALAFLALLLERLAEMVVARRNYLWSMERGGKEFGASHYKWMVILHAMMLAAMVFEWLFFPTNFGTIVLSFLGSFCVLTQCLRWWVIQTLGQQWNTRIIVIPGAKRIFDGPYRYMSHPNYLAVVIEMVCLPWFFGAFWTGLVFSLLNAWMLRVRIVAENDALCHLSST